MQNRGTWIAFLTMCFALTGMVGLFASYSTQIPLDRAMHRLEVLDRGLEPGQADAAIREAMGREAASVIARPGDDANHLAHARALVREEAASEVDSITPRTRWLICVITVVAAAVGAGLLMLAGRPAAT